MCEETFRAVPCRATCLDSEWSLVSVVVLPFVGLLKSIGGIYVIQVGFREYKSKIST